MAVRPRPRLLHGDLAAEDFAAVAEWVTLNAPALVGYWDGRLSTVELVSRLRRV